jgi:predicted  nucleic acid-binding Zn-ribbon protein
LAHRAGISLLSARRITHRHKWRKIRGNDGRTLVHVPIEYLEKRDADSQKPVASTVTSTADTTVTPTVTSTVDMTEIVSRLDRLQAEMIEMAKKLGASEAETTAAKAALDELRQDRDHWRQMAETAQQQQAQAVRQQDELRVDRDTWRAQAERLAAVGSELQAAREERERLLGDSETMRERMVGAERDRDQALERLNHNIDRLDRVQTEHHTEITAVQEQLAQAKRDRDRLAAELETHLRMPWWRRLFA